MTGGDGSGRADRRIAELAGAVDTRRWAAPPTPSTRWRPRRAVGSPTSTNGCGRSSATVFGLVVETGLRRGHPGEHAGAEVPRVYGRLVSERGQLAGARLPPGARGRRRAARLDELAYNLRADPRVARLHRRRRHRGPAVSGRRCGGVSSTSGCPAGREEFGPGCCTASPAHQEIVFVTRTTTARGRVRPGRTDYCANRCGERLAERW